VVKERNGVWVTEDGDSCHKTGKIELVCHNAPYLPSISVRTRRIPRCEVSLLGVGRMLSERGGMFPGCSAPFPVGFYHVFAQYRINSTIFGKQLYNIKMCVLIFPTTLSETFILRRILRDTQVYV